MTDGHDDDATGGREAVRVHFVKRIKDAGIAPPKGMTVATFDDMLKRLVDWLSYMDAENLNTLAEQVLDATGGPKRTQCPSELVIRNFAKSLHEKPIFEHPIITNWLASREGPMAKAAGHLVELFQFIRENRRQPFVMDKIDIAKQADVNQRKRAQIEGWIDRNVATAEQRAWMQAYLADERMANDIVAAGAERRAAKQAGAVA